MKKTTIFLDIDGVLLTEIYSIFLDGMEKIHKIPSKDKYGYFFNPYPIHLLNELHKIVYYDIVITSQWRLDLKLEGLKNMWLNRNYPSKIVGVTENISPNKRSLEIENYIKTNKIKNYFIIDDLDKFLFSEELHENFIQCDPLKGFGFSEYTQILNKI